MVVQNYIWMFCIDWGEGKCLCSLFSQGDKSTHHMGGINMWAGKVAVASLPSMVFSLTFLQGQFVAESWQAELLQPCCISNRNVPHPCRETSPAWQRARRCLRAPKHQKLPGFKAGTISLTGSKLLEGKISIFPLEA